VELGAVDSGVLDYEARLRHPTLGASVWRLRQPWQWWGAEWLPEFWLTVVLGMELKWSVWRGRIEKERVSCTFF
jgi:hypothetical protein